MPPTYEYSCPLHGTIEIVHSIKEPARTKCPLCGKHVTRLISGGNGVAIMDADRLYDMLPKRGPGDSEVREAKTDLHKSEAFLIGVPPAEREYYRRLHHKSH